MTVCSVWPCKLGKNSVPLSRLVEQDELISRTLTPEEVEDCFDYRYHLKQVDTIFTRLGLDD